MKVLCYLLITLLAGGCFGQVQPSLSVYNPPEMQQSFDLSIKNEDNLIPFHNSEGKWGYLDATTDTVVIAPKYDNAELFHRGIARIGQVNPHPGNYSERSLIGFINSKGEEIFSPAFTSASNVEIMGDRVTAESLYYLRWVSCGDGTAGVIDVRTGGWVIKLSKEKRIIFYDRHHFVVDDEWLYAGDKKLKIPDWLKIEWVYFSPHFIRVQKESGVAGIYSWEGEKVIPVDYLDFEIDTASKRIIASRLKGGTTLGNLKRIVGSADRDGNDIVVDLFDYQGNKIASYNSRYQGMLAGYGTGAFQVGEQNIYFNLKDGKILSDRKRVIQRLPGGYEVFEKNDKAGLRSASGDIIIAPKYRSIDFIDSGHIVAQTEGLHYLVYNLQGEKVFNSEYSDLQYLPDLKRFLVSVNDKAGQIDRKGKVIIPLEYGGFSSLSLMQLPPYAVYKDGRHGIIDGQGKTVLPFEYDDITDTRVLDSTVDAYFVVEKAAHYGLMDAEGRWIISPDYGYIYISKSDFEDKWVHLEAYPRSSNLNGAYNLAANALIFPKYSSVETYKDFVIVANRIGNEYYHQLLSPSGKVLSDTGYTKMEFTNSYLLCEKNGMCGILDTKGAVIIPFNYQRIIPQTSKLLLVEKNANYFYMNINGKEYMNPVNTK